MPASLIHHIRKVFSGEIHNIVRAEQRLPSGPQPIAWKRAGSTVSIGLPIANTQIYMLDTELQLVAPR